MKVFCRGLLAIGLIAWASLWLEILFAGGIDNRVCVLTGKGTTCATYGDVACNQALTACRDNANCNYCDTPVELPETICAIEEGNNCQDAGKVANCGGEKDGAFLKVGNCATVNTVCGCRNPQPKGFCDGKKLFECNLAP